MIKQVLLVTRIRPFTPQHTHTQNHPNPQSDVQEITLTSPKITPTSWLATDTGSEAQTTKQTEIKS